MLVPQSSPSSPPLPALLGLRELAPRYDAFLVDLHGVIHDGTAPFDGAVAGLRELSRAKRRVVFLTNTSRSGDVVTLALTKMGIGPELYEAVISSGDVTREALLARDPALFDLLAARPRAFHVGNPAFVPWLFEPDLGLHFTDDSRDADLVVATGIVRDDAALARTRAELAPFIARGVPLVCTNPDRVIPTAAGLTLGPGAIAATYAELGGRVFLYGKPHAPMYASARELLGETPAERIVAVGDLLATDVRGARSAGIASVLVTATGGHAATLGPAPSDVVQSALWASEGIAPDMLLARFAW
jgi:HAD superfamily hydrolase (TIGR01459 family)